MALTRTLTLYNGSDSLPAVDYTTDTDWPQTELTGGANRGDGSAGGWLVRDEGGIIPDYTSPGHFLSSHNVVIVTVGSNTLYRGRIAGQDQFRGRQKAGRANEWQITLSDNNAHLEGIVVHDWARPTETDAARVQAMVAAYLTGSPRVTTNLNGSNLVITGSNTISLPAKTYTGTTPHQVLAEIAEQTNKEMFVTVDNELAYFGNDYTAYASLLRISDDPADANSTTYAPWEPHSTGSGLEQLSALRVYTAIDGVEDTFQLTNATLAAETDYWEDVLWDSTSATSAEATARAANVLQYRKFDDQRAFTCSIGPMSGDEIWKIKPGQTITFKSRGALGGRSIAGAYVADAFRTVRIRELRWTMPAEDQYIAHLTMERPRRVSYSRGSETAHDVAALNQSSTSVGGAVGGGGVGAACQTTNTLWTDGSYDLFPYKPGTVGIAGGTITLTSVAWGALLTSQAIGVYTNGVAFVVVAGVGTLSGHFALPVVPTGVDHSTAITLVGTGGDGNVSLTLSQDDSSGYPLQAYSVATTPNFINYSTFSSGTIAFRIKTSATTVWIKSWSISDPEPDWQQTGTWNAGNTNILHVTQQCNYTDGSGSPAGYVAVSSNLVWCPGADAPTATYGQMYGPRLVAIADGGTSSWTLPYPTAYQPGTLEVMVDGVDQNHTEVSPTAGTFSLPWVPASGDEISASWRVPVSI